MSTTRTKKGVDEDAKLKKSIEALEHALSFEGKARKDAFYFAGIAKSFEICIEYAWNYLKRKVMDEGLDAYSPKEAIKLAGRIGLIDNVEKWLDFLEDRNLAVHDYLGVSDEEYLKTTKEFLSEAKKLIGSSK
jgi:nucleotidyltransferase substrate binding protein (TIGR01987 family)